VSGDATARGVRDVAAEPSLGRELAAEPGG
jgi:hypothetical protein